MNVSELKRSYVSKKGVRKRKVLKKEFTRLFFVKGSFKYTLCTHVIMKLNQLNTSFRSSPPEVLLYIMVTNIKQVFWKMPQIYKRTPIPNCDFKKSSHRRCSVKKVFYSNLIKERLQYRRFPVKFATFFRTTILKNICQRLLLSLMFKLKSAFCRSETIFSHWELFPYGNQT